MARAARWRWPAALLLYVTYNVIIFTTWAAVGADYRNLVGETVVLRRLVLPLALGAAFLVGALSAVRAWRPVLQEAYSARPRWALWIILAGMAGLFAANSVSAHWNALSARHLTMLVAAGVLVGFNEEVVARGVLVVGLRTRTSNELWVWLGSSALFGAMHLPNALFGLPWYGGVIQGVLASLAGGALYVLRRTSGGLILPMAMHGLWDFTSFTAQASHGYSPISALFQFSSYALGIVGVIVVLRRDRRAHSASLPMPA